MDESTAGAHPRSLTVLVADPSLANAESLALVLAACGHRVYTAGTAVSALAAAADPPEVLITESAFGDLDGFDLAALFAEGRSPRPLLILLTGRPVPEQAVRRSGFDGHFVKPADLDALLRFLAAHAARRDV